MRFQGQPGHVAFVEYNKETLQPNLSAEFKFAEASEGESTDDFQKLDWSERKLPQSADEAAEAEEEQKTEEQKADEERLRSSRKVGPTPLASDGRFIYAMTTQIKREEENGLPTIEKVHVEVYEIEATTNMVKFVKQVQLKRDTEVAWVYRTKNYTTDSGYLNHLQCACNGRIFVVNHPNRTYFFNVETGVRIAKSAKRDPRSLFQLVHEVESNFFCAFQINVFQGFQRKITIKGFTKRKTEEEIEK